MLRSRHREVDIAKSMLMALVTRDGVKTVLLEESVGS